MKKLIPSLHKLRLKVQKHISGILKGQLISKCLFGFFNSPQKLTKTIRLEVP